MNPTRTARPPQRPPGSGSLRAITPGESLRLGRLLNQTARNLSMAFKRDAWTVVRSEVADLHVGTDGVHVRWKGTPPALLLAACDLAGKQLEFGGRIIHEWPGKTAEVTT